ncbi:MAG: hypothetical protein IKT55_00085 [Clostridia bacterium]|nr:hypothetical protein [Clostridia bacterium]
MQTVITRRNDSKVQKSKSVIISLVAAVLVLSLIMVAIICAAVMYFYNSRCYDCGNSLVFENHVSCYVCEERHDRWMAKEYGVTE